MSFRKRNVGIGSASSQSDQDYSSPSVEAPWRGPPPGPTGQAAFRSGVRPSALDGRLTTSTGTPSLDELLAGQGGLALGTSILLEESGTTDYAGILLKYYAAEGLVQGHTVHVLGVGEQWGRGLPGLVSSEGAKDTKLGRREDAERMKIAWRYERLALSASEVAGSRAQSSMAGLKDVSASDLESDVPAAFCHVFDLTKRLSITASSQINYIPLNADNPATSPFVQVLHKIQTSLSESTASSIHRVVLPMLLSPAAYPSHACLPQNLLQFLHGLRGMLRQFAGRLSAMASLPLDLYPRSSGLVRWMELLSDGVMELTPFPHLSQDEPSHGHGHGSSAPDEQPQGLFQTHALPIFHERGGGGIGGHKSGDDLAFTVSRKKFVIKPFNLPPIEGDTGGPGLSEDQKPKTADMEF